MQTVNKRVMTEKSDQKRQKKMPCTWPPRHGIKSAVVTTAAQPTREFCGGAGCHSRVDDIRWWPDLMEGLRPFSSDVLCLTLGGPPENGVSQNTTPGPTKNEGDVVGQPRATDPKGRPKKHAKYNVFIGLCDGVRRGGSWHLFVSPAFPTREAAAQGRAAAQRAASPARNPPAALTTVCMR